MYCDLYCVLCVFAVGYSGAGAFSDDHVRILPGSGWDHHGVRRDVTGGVVEL